MSDDEKSRREDRLLDAAVETFVRYGIRRATMGDIAQTANVSRQTLYANYANKDEIVAASIDRICRESVVRIEDAWRQASSLETKLDAYFDIAVVATFDMIRQSPDSDDMISGRSVAAKEAVQKADTVKVRKLSDLFRPYASALLKSGQTPEQLAIFVQTSSAGFKYSASDRDGLLQLLKTLKTMILCMLAEDARSGT